MKESTKKLFQFLKDHDGQDFTAADIAEELGIDVKSVNGSFTAGLQKKGYGMREEVEIATEDGSTKKIKLLRLTDEGRAFDLASA